MYAAHLPQNDASFVNPEEYAVPVKRGNSGLDSDSEKKKKKRISYSGPLLASGRILIVSSYGELLAFDPQTGEQTASLDIKDTTYIEPIAVQGKVFLLTDEAKLVAIQ